MAHSAVRFLANPPPATSSGPPVARIVPANITLNDLLTANGSASVTGNSQADKSQTSTFLNLLTLRQRMMLQASQQQLSSVGGENEEPNLVVAGLRQLLAAPHTPLLQQLVQSVSLEKHASLRGPGSVVSSSGSTALVAGRSDTLPLACISPAPSIGPVSGASCATPPAPSPDSGRGKRQISFFWTSIYLADRPLIS
jgi:antitoxin (DNA-binding transcriptional repressor) of toxin-antitoxin stability system